MHINFTKLSTATKDCKILNFKVISGLKPKSQLVHFQHNFKIGDQLLATFKVIYFLNSHWSPPWHLCLFQSKTNKKQNLTINTFLYFIHISCTIQLELLNFNFFGSYWEKNSGDKKIKTGDNFFFGRYMKGVKPTGILHYIFLCITMIANISTENYIYIFDIQRQKKQNYH